MLLDFLLAAMAALTVVALLVPLLRRRSPTPPLRVEQDLAVYRDQLAEVEHEQGQGILAPDQAAAAQVEIERRLLAAAARDATDEPQRKAVSQRLDRMLPIGLALVLPLFALGLYLDIGRPGLPSAPFDPRRAAALEQASRQNVTPAQAVAAARARVEKDPDNAEAQSELGEALVMEADGTVGEPAVAAFAKALAKEPGDARAIFYLGLHEAQSGDPRAALTRWLDLEARADPAAPWLHMVREEIDRVAKASGIDPLSIRPDRKPPATVSPGAAAPLPPPSAANGMPVPTPEQREAMARMTPEQRQQAIHGMVEGLEAKLKETPQDRAGWLRLANAWRVLGESTRGAAAYAKADALAPLDTAQLVDWAEALVRRTTPGAAPSPEAVAVLTRVEKAQPNNALALFYLGAASLADGDKVAALKRWKTLQEMLPKDAPIRAMLDEKIKAAEGAR